MPEITADAGRYSAAEEIASCVIHGVGIVLSIAGLAVLSAGIPSVPLLTFAVASLGFSLGAEGDIAAYLVTRYFPAELFSTVLGLVAAAMAVSALVGSLVLSRTVATTGGYALFLTISATTMLLGSLLFLALRGNALFKVGGDSQKTSTGTKATTGVGFTPSAGLFITIQTNAAGHQGNTIFSIGSSPGHW